MSKLCLILAVLVCLVAGIAGGLSGQMATPPQLPPRTSIAAGAQGASPRIPVYNTLYCSGFITDRDLQDLTVLTGEEGMKNEFVPGDVLYLNRGTKWVVNPGGEYMMLRRMVDVNNVEIFPGQRKLLKELGTLYAEVGRIRVNIINDRSVTAQVLQACESISVGDIAIPFDVKPAPELRPSTTFDRFAPPSGKGDGMIVAAKDFGMILRKGDIGYMDIGSREGVTIGQYYRIYRPFQGSPYLDLYKRYRNNVPEKINGMLLNVRLTPEQMKGLPRDVVGEAVVLHVEGRSATLLVTFSVRDIVVGDYIELE